MRALGPIVSVLAILAAACSSEEQQVVQPREPEPGAIGHYCRMTLAEHKGPKGQILPRGWSEPVWFSSVRDALTYVEQEIVSDREIAGFWVNDMTQGTWDKPAPGSWIDARSAVYVIGSSKSSGMGGTEAVPFKERVAAEAFVTSFGGRLASYEEARRAMSSDADAGGASNEKGGT